MKLFRNILLLTLVSFFIQSCSSGTSDEKSEAMEEDLNYPAEGFDIEGSDPQAIVLADKVMTSMGGRKAWDNTRYLSWNFFGARKLLWDKQAGNVRIDIPKDDITILMNVDEMTGKVQKKGVEVSADSVSYYLNMGKRIWINDSYWLVMPFKLKDSGVTLNYIREDTTQAGEMSDVLRLTFEDVGVTPNNAYEVWISNEDYLVKQWAYYTNASDSLPRFTLPWGDYQQKGDILLSGERGERDLTEIEVLESVPEGTFTRFDVAI